MDPHDHDMDELRRRQEAAGARGMVCGRTRNIGWGEEETGCRRGEGPEAGHCRRGEGSEAGHCRRGEGSEAGHCHRGEGPEAGHCHRGEGHGVGHCHRDWRHFEEGFEGEERLFFLFHRCSHLLARGAARGKGDGCGRNPGQGRVLGILAERGNMSQQELLEILNVRPSSLSELLGKLEGAGCVTRVRGEDDRRSVTVSITEAGRELVRSHTCRRESAAQALFASLTEEEREELTRLLSKLAGAWEKEEPQAGPGKNNQEETL